MQKSNAKQQGLTIKNFIEALRQLKKVGYEDNKYQDIKLTDWFDENNRYKVKKNLGKDQKVAMCKYLMYLFAGALAKDVNKATGDVLAKGLNKKIKDMNNEDFVQYVKKIYIDPEDCIEENAKGRTYSRTKLMNDTASCKSLFGIKIRPSGYYNDGIWKMSCYILDFLGEIKEGKDMIYTLGNGEKGKFKLDFLSKREKDNILQDCANNFNEYRNKIFTGDLKYIPVYNRPFINAKRVLKKLFGTQDFSYASNKYKNVFACFDLDKTKTGSIAK